MRKKIHCLVLFVLLFGNSLLAQNDTLFFRHYSVEHGLSHNNVTSIIQDSLGFMWYGTTEGLNKFDGYNFIAYKHDPKNPNSLTSDDISCLAVDKSGIIFIGTRNNPNTAKKQRNNRLEYNNSAYRFKGFERRRTNFS